MRLDLTQVINPWATSFLHAAAESQTSDVPIDPTDVDISVTVGGVEVDIRILLTKLAKQWEAERITCRLEMLSEVLTRQDQDADNELQAAQRDAAFTDTWTPTQLNSGANDRGITALQNNPDSRVGLTQTQAMYLVGELSGEVNSMREALDLVISRAHDASELTERRAVRAAADGIRAAIRECALPPDVAGEGLEARIHGMDDLISHLTAAVNTAVFTPPPLSVSAVSVPVIPGAEIGGGRVIVHDGRPTVIGGAPASMVTGVDERQFVIDVSNDIREMGMRGSPEHSGHSASRARASARPVPVLRSNLQIGRTDSTTATRTPLEIVVLAPPTQEP
jgi:hypothetical protein